MADSAVMRRFLVLWTIVCVLYQTPEIQASTVIPSVSANTSSPSPGPLSNSSATPWISSINVYPSSSAGQLVQSTQFISSDTTTSQAANENTIAPTSQPTSSSQTATANASVTTTPTTTDLETEAVFSKTEYILIACLAVFALIFIAIIVLVGQIIRLNKSVKNLKATGQR